jgi:hypothetical protein
MKTLPEEFNEKPFIKFHGGNNDHEVFLNGLLHVSVHVAAIFGLIVIYKMYYGQALTRDLIPQLLKISFSVYLVLHTVRSAFKTWRDYQTCKECDCFICQSYAGYGSTFAKYFLFIYKDRL